VAGRVEEINIAPEFKVLPTPVERVEVLRGQGPVGDRYFAPAPREPGEGDDLTLIAAEALEGLAADTGIELSAAEARRNVLTRGIDLNALVGRRFLVGDVECVGVELCEPCNHLQALTVRGVLRGLVHRGGLRADVLSSGTIAVGDVIAEPA